MPSPIDPFIKLGCGAVHIPITEKHHWGVNLAYKEGKILLEIVSGLFSMIYANKRVTAVIALVGHEQQC